MRAVAEGLLTFTSKLPASVLECLSLASPKVCVRVCVCVCVCICQTNFFFYGTAEPSYVHVYAAQDDAGARWTGSQVSESPC